MRVKASYKLIRLIRPVYGARKSGIVKADLPLSVFGFSKLDESFWAEVLVRRTCDHLPFNRQVQILARDGINITRQCLSKAFINTGGTLQDLGMLLKKNILSLPVIHVDETTIKMQMPGKKSLHTAYLWVLAGRPANFEDKEPLVWMDFKTNRKHENAEELIEDYNKVMHSDVFQGYEKLAEKGQFTWAPCWVIYQCACPAQVCVAICEIRDLHTFQVKCLDETETDKAIHMRIKEAAEESHLALEKCLTDVLNLEGWDLKTLTMPESI